MKLPNFYKMLNVALMKKVNVATMKKAFMVRPLGMIASVSVLFVTFAMSAITPWDYQARQRKADHLFSEAVTRRSIDDNEGTFALLQRAFDLDSTDSHIGSLLAQFYTFTSTIDDSKTINRIIELTHRRFQDAPSDIENAMLYAYIGEHFTDNDPSLYVWEKIDSIYPDRGELTLKYIDALLETKDSANVVKALSRLPQLEEAYGVTPVISSRVVTAHYLQADTVSIIREVNHLIESAPLEANNYLFAAHVMEELSDGEKTVYYLNRACEVDSTNGDAYYARANFFRQHGDTTAYYNDIRHLLFNTDLDPSDKKDIALDYIRAYYGDSTMTDTAVTLVEQLTDKYPHEIEYRKLLASFLATLERHDIAAEQFRIISDLDPTEPNNFINTASQYYFAGEMDKEEETLDRGLSLFPDNSDLWYLKVVTLIASDREDEAIEAARQAINLESLDKAKRSEFYTIIGDIYYKRGDVDEAFAEYTKALDENPDNISAMNNFAYFLAVEGRDLDEAVRLGRLATLADPENPTFIDTYAYALYRRGDYNLARQYIERALAIGGADIEENFDILDHAGDIYFMCGDVDAAVEYWQKALKIEPENVEVRNKISNRSL